MKDALMQVRINRTIEQGFRDACHREGRTTSEVLRSFCSLYAAAAEVKYTTLAVSLSIGDPEEDGTAYPVTATVSGDWVSLLEEDGVDFLLPRLSDSDAMTGIHVESYYSHRSIFPNCRDDQGRLIGARLKKTGNNSLQWQGAVFFSRYFPQKIDFPDPFLEEIRKNLDEAVLSSLSDLFGSDSAISVLLSSKMEYGMVLDYKNFLIRFDRPAKYQYGAWRMVVELKTEQRKKVGVISGAVEIPKMKNRIVHPDTDYSDAHSCDNVYSVGIRFIDGIARSHVYTNGIEEEKNETSLKEVADEVSKCVEDYLSKAGAI